MKTNVFKYFSLTLMAVMMVSLVSCEVEIDSFYDDDNIGGGYYARSSELCSPHMGELLLGIWTVIRCRQELDFFLDRTGIDYIRVEYPNGIVDEYEYGFRWSWENYAQTSIRMSYGPNDVSYLDDVYLGGNRLTGYLDGRNNYVEFMGR